MKTLRLLPALSAQTRRHMAAGVALACLSSLAGFGLLFLSGWLLAGAAVAGIGGLAARQAFNILLPATGVRFFATVRILARYGEKLVAHNSALKIVGQLRTWCYRHLAPLAPAGLHHHRGGDLLSRFVTDTDLIGQHYTNTLLPYVRAAVCGCIFISITALFSPQAGLCLTAGLLTGGLILPFITGMISDKLAVKLTDLHSQNRTELTDILASTGECLAPGATHRLQDHFSQQQHKLMQTRRLLAAAESGARALTSLCTTLTTLSVLIVATKSFQNNSLSLSEVPMLVLGCLAAFDVITPLPAARQTLSLTRLAARRLHSACMASPLVPAPAKTEHISNASSLQIKNLSFRYPETDQWIFRHASLTIQQGERVALTGISGSGKSSLINILFRFYPFQEGICQFGNTDIQNIQSEDLAKIIAVASQNFHLFNGTLRDNMLLADPHATDKEIMDALRIVCLTDWLKETPKGLETPVGNEGFQISGGQARRLNLAQTLLRNTPWIFLDEPTEGLDAETEKAVMSNLIKEKPDATLVCITHRRSILPFMTRIIHIQNNIFCPEEEETQ